MPKIGERFGRWTVIGAGERPRRHVCRCDCGTVREVSESTLYREDHPRSCGCYQQAPPSVRFWRQVEVHETGCWLWTGGLNGDGYASLSSDGECTLAHRWSYEHFRGPIPEGLQIDHLCRVRRCVNPDHLEVVGLRENLIRGERRNQHTGRTHCRRGHEYTPANTGQKAHNPRSRVCLTCRAEYGRRAKERAREKRRAKRLAEEQAA